MPINKLACGGIQLDQSADDGSAGGCIESRIDLGDLALEGLVGESIEDHLCRVPDLEHLIIRFIHIGLYVELAQIAHRR